MTSVRRSIGRCVGVGALLVGGLLAGLSSPSGAAPTAGSATFHLYTVFVTDLYVEANGQLTPSNQVPDAGGYFYFVGNAYVGTKKSHAKQATASVDLICTLASPTNGICDGSIAMGGVLMVANHSAVTLSPTGISPLELTDATGKYKNDDGLATIALFSSGGANVTVTLHPEAYVGFDLVATNVNGVSVGTVEAGSAAQKAGLAEGDVITSVGGQTVVSAISFFSALNQYSPGDKVQIGWTTASGQQMSATVALIGENK